MAKKKKTAKKKIQQPIQTAHQKTKPLGNAESIAEKINAQQNFQEKSLKENFSDDDQKISEKNSEEKNSEEKNSENENDGDEMSITNHLAELRKRIIYSLITIVIGSCIAYYFIDDLMKLLAVPSGKLYYLQPAEAFFTQIKMALFTGCLFALPMIFYEIWKFILPALTMRERIIIGVLVPSSVILFFIGLAFAFFLVLPAAIKFFIGFSTENLQPMFTLNQYFSFVLNFILPFGFVFEIPLVILVLAKLGLISSAYLRKKRKIIIFSAFVVGAVISPTPDIFTQSMIAVPLILLYEISHFIVKFILKK